MKRLFIALSCLGLLSACQVGSGAGTSVSTMPDMPAMGAAEQPAEALSDIVDTAVAAGQFETLAQALTAANLVETLKGEGPFTVFAPTDEDFAALPEGTLDNLLANPEELAKVLTYHVVSGKVMAEKVVMMDSAATVEGSEVNIMVEGDMVKVNNATVVQTDIQTSNGVIHVIDSVLLPPES